MSDDWTVIDKGWSHYNNAPLFWVWSPTRGLGYEAEDEVTAEIMRDRYNNGDHPSDNIPALADQSGGDHE